MKEEKAMKQMKNSFIALIAIVLILSGSLPVRAIEVSDLAEPDSFVNDYADELSKEDLIYLELICRRTQRTTTAEIAIVIIETLDDANLEDFAMELFNTWGLGTEEDDNGVLMLIVLRDRVWRISTGLGIEYLLTENILSEIMEEEAEPEFRDGNYGFGLIRAAEEIMEILEEEFYDD
jgi:uncharacterized protein